MEPVRVRVRVAGKVDLADVLRLYGQPDLDDGAVLPITQAQEMFDRFARYPDYVLYVAELDGKIVGTFALLVMDNLAHMGTPSAVVEDVVVDAAHRGQGIGHAMMTYAVAVCRSKGCYKMALSSNLKREKAHAFYDSLGFERHGYSFRISPQEQK